MLTETRAVKLGESTEPISPWFIFIDRFARYPLFLHTIITSLNSKICQEGYFRPY